MRMRIVWTIRINFAGTGPSISVAGGTLSTQTNRDGLVETARGSYARGLPVWSPRQCAGRPHGTDPVERSRNTCRPRGQECGKRKKKKGKEKKKKKPVLQSHIRHRWPRGLTSAAYPLLVVPVFRDVFSSNCRNKPTNTSTTVEHDAKRKRKRNTSGPFGSHTRSTAVPWSLARCAGS